MNRNTMLIVAFVAITLMGLLLYSSMSLGGYTVEVCKQYEGRQACGTGSGTSETEAMSTATGVACAKIASGMTDSNKCQMGEPISVKWIKGR